MKHSIKFAGLVMTLLLLIGTFTSCKKTVTKKVIADNTIVAAPKEQPKVIREPLVFIAGVPHQDDTL